MLWYDIMSLVWLQKYDLVGEPALMHAYKWDLLRSKVHVLHNIGVYCEFRHDVCRNVYQIITYTHDYEAPS